MISASPFDQGARAHLAGVPKCCNPYRIPGAEQSNWDDGWDHAEEHRERLEHEHV